MWCQSLVFAPQWSHFGSTPVLGGDTLVVVLLGLTLPRVSKSFVGGRGTVSRGVVVTLDWSDLLTPPRTGGNGVQEPDYLSVWGRAPGRLASTHVAKLVGQTRCRGRDGLNLEPLRWLGN